MTSNSAARSKTCAMCRHSATFGSTSGSSEYPRATTAPSRPDVNESAVAKRVVSTPFATSPSVSNEANCSQGP